MGLNINEWGFLLSDEQVVDKIGNYKTEIYNYTGSIDEKVILELYNTIVNHPSLSDRAKLFYMDKFEDLLLKGRIQTENDVLNYMNSIKA